MQVFGSQNFPDFHGTPEPFYNTIFGVHAKICVSYPNHVISRVKIIN